MRIGLILILFAGSFAWAQDKDTESTKRLNSVTWDLNTHKLVWVVETGKEVNGAFVPATSQKYEVSPDEAVMMFQDEARGFTADEAASLHHLLDVLSLYCAESTVWWDQGQGVPVDKKTTKSTPDGKAAPDGKAVRVEQQQPKPKKPVRVLDGNMIAENRNR